MSTDSDRPSGPGPVVPGDSGPEPRVHAPIAPIAPIGPSAFVRAVVQPMTKVLNPVIRQLAGRRRFRMAAQVRHVGRRSGKPYVTPVGVRRAGELAVIALTFGNRSDWSQNVRAAGGCAIRMDGVDYVATEPRFLSPDEARPLVLSAFSRTERASFRLLGIRQFLSLRLAPARA
jgi:deazaflavin-dependent oxidoreductase (nitroreductase family)